MQCLSIRAATRMALCRQNGNTFATSSVSENNFLDSDTPVNANSTQGCTGGRPENGNIADASQCRHRSGAHAELRLIVPPQPVNAAPT
jgi:hypothetical protein